MLVIILILIVFFFILLGIIYSNIIIDINNCNISCNDTKLDIEKIDISMKIYIFKFLKIKINRNIKFDILKKINKKYDGKIDVLNIIKIIFNSRKKLKLKYLNPKLNSIDLCLYFGTYNQMLTTFSIPIISIFISVLLSKLISSYDNKYYNYRIFPEYSNKNYLSINLVSEIQFSTINLIIFLFKIK